MISVAMTTYNGEKYIKSQLDSILDQSVPIDEIIICDDGSTDRTCEIIKSYTSEKIKLIKNEQNLGYIENFYKAISLTKGDYIFLADQDDIWMPYKVEKQVSHMKQTRAMAVCSKFELIDGEGVLISDTSSYQIDPYMRKVKKEVARLTTLRLAFGNIAQGCTYCFNRQVRDKYLQIHNNEVIHDYQIMLIASCLGRVDLLNQKLVRYRIHGNNSVGFAKKNREIKINKKISKEPYMYRFMKQIHDVIGVRNLFGYKILYYARIPFIRAIFRRKLFGA